MNADIHTSVTRITDLSETSYELRTRRPEVWEMDEYVLARVTQRPDSDVWIEDHLGRRVELMEGETVVGALGTRRATRGYVGSFEDVAEDGRMHVMTGGGVLGRVVSTSPFSPSPIEVEYVGHVAVDDDVVRMGDHALDPVDAQLETPVVLVYGTSMSSGKTMSIRVITRVLVEQGYSVAACKLTGAGTYKDALSMAVAGAEPIYDFVDAGLPTTVVSDGTFRASIEPVLGHVEAHDSDVDVLVAEVGASPLEPYSGETAIELIEDNVAFSVLCATDPYAVVGIESAFGRTADVVAGIATNTTAGIDLIEEFTDCTPLNLTQETSKEPLVRLLDAALS